MIYQIGDTILLKAPYSKNKLGATGLTVTLRGVYKNGVLISGSSSYAVTEIAFGLYGATLPGDAVDAIGDYVAVFTTADTSVDMRDAYGYAVVIPWVGKVDANISSRNATAPDNTGIASLLARLTSARAGYLDNLNVGGLVASSTEATAIQNNQRVVRVIPEMIERPDSGTAVYAVRIYCYTSSGMMETPDVPPEIHVTNQTGINRDARLDSTTTVLEAAGQYKALYTASPTDATEQLLWQSTVTKNGVARNYGNTSLIVDTTAVDFTAADRAKLDAMAADYARRMTDIPSATAIRSEIDANSTKLDVAVGTRLAAADYVTPGGTGPYTVTVNSGTPGAAVSLSAGIDVLKGTTGDDGTLELYPAGLGAYALIVTKAGYTPISRNETLADGMTIDAELTPAVIAQPSDPDMRTVAFDSQHFGVFATGVEIKYKIMEIAPITREKRYEKGDTASIKTGEDGRALQDLYVNTRHLAHSEACGLRAQFVVPETHTTWLLEDLIADTAAADAA